MALTRRFVVLCSTAALAAARPLRLRCRGGSAPQLTHGTPGTLGNASALNATGFAPALNASGEPTGRMPMLLRIADHFGIDRAVAKDVCKTLVLRVLNGGSVVAWIREMGIDAPAEEQTDLRDLAEAARIVREAFFALLDREQPGTRETLKASVASMLEDRHQRRVQDARRNGETPPQPPGNAARDRTMFSHIMFDLEDRVLDCIDCKLRALGWTVASLIYDGVRPAHPSARLCSVPVHVL